MPLQSAALIYNPTAGRRKMKLWIPSLLTALEGSGFAAEALPTRGPGDAGTLAREASSRGIETVFALGGDGTIREAATGLLGTSTRLCILPGGSTNVLARALGLPLDPVLVAHRAGHFGVTGIDVGLCNGEPFLMMASVGLDARVLERQDSALKRALGRSGVFLLGLAEWWRYGYPAVDGTLDGKDFNAPFVAVCNIPLYGGAFRLAPDARFDDGLFDLVLFEGRTRASTLGFARDLALGRHRRRQDVSILRGRTVRLRLPKGASLQVDGDCLEVSGGDVEITFANEKLALWVPVSDSGGPPAGEAPE